MRNPIKLATFGIARTFLGYSSGYGDDGVAKCLSWSALSWLNGILGKFVG